MQKIISWYNQNRGKVWIGVIIIIFCIAILYLLNLWAKQELDKDKEEIEKANQKNEITYEQQSKSIVSGGKVDKTYQKKFGNVIDTFLTNCVQHNYEEAYQLLSTKCKEELYPSKRIFIDNYGKENFEGEKQYEFQSWTSKGNYIYLIKIYENILASGKANSNYIQDYYTIVDEGGEYKLNISSLVGKQEYQGKKGNNQNINIKLKDTTVYMDYQYYTITVNNQTENTILLDTRKKTNTLYTINSNGVKIESLLYENSERDLKIEPGEEKQIKIKFSNSYQTGVTINKMVFSNIVTNYEAYKNEKEDYDQFETIEIEI